MRDFLSKLFNVLRGDRAAAPTPPAIFDSQYRLKARGALHDVVGELKYRYEVDRYKFAVQETMNNPYFISFNIGFGVGMGLSQAMADVHTCICPKLQIMIYNDKVRIITRFFDGTNQLTTTEDLGGLPDGGEYSEIGEAIDFCRGYFEEAISRTCPKYESEEGPSRRAIPS